MKKVLALLATGALLLGTLAGCGEAQETVTSATEKVETSVEAKTEETPAKDVDLAFFTGKVETVDLIDEIIADYNAQSNGVTVEQEYQADASNIIKIKFVMMKKHYSLFVKKLNMLQGLVF